MSVTDYYSPVLQLSRALGRDWRLHSLELLCGILYPLVGFYMGRRVGHSQVYNVIAPFLVAAAFTVYLTRRVCLPEVKRESVFTYFNLPQDRLKSLDAHVVFLCITVIWLNAWAFLGSLLKLGGAGMTACYRLHPEFAVVPLLAVALTIRHVYLAHTWAFWGRSVIWHVLLATWVIWRGFATVTLPAHARNNYWPDRDISLAVEWAVACLMVGAAVWLICSTRNQWRTRQIGGIQ